MLKSLSIENYALIEKSEIAWNPGFSVITGETGSGKSILMGALGLLLGQRSDMKTLKNPERKCVVEAEFEVSNYGLKDFFSENELDYDDVCLIRRELLPNGKSRSFVNDTPVSISLLKELGRMLIDIHSQHENLRLNEGAFQLSLLDSFSGNNDLLEEYRGHYNEYLRLKKSIQTCEDRLAQLNADRDYVEFQLNQLDEAAFVEGEQEELEQESNALTHASEIWSAIECAVWSLSEKEESALSSLKEATNALASVESFCDAEWTNLRSRVESTLIEVKDVVREIESRQGSFEVDPQRLESVNSRLDLLYTLEKKHRVDSLAELLAVRNAFAEKLQSMESSSDELDGLKAELEQQILLLTDISTRLHDSRQEKSASLAERLALILVDLGMPNVRFEIEVKQGLSFTPTGCDEVNFFFSANKNQSLQPLSAVASGGEISRVMLAMKSILSQSKRLPTIIFDEVDTGVSGEVADRMGLLMKQMAAGMQVISITHLPQIASKGQTHYKVYKEDEIEVSVSKIKCLTADERVTEIAQMLSGAVLSEAAMHNARELLKG